jgi:addiction module RelE/StbE family toxin
LSRTQLELRWRPLALADREAIMTFIAQDNITAAIELDMLFEEKAEIARKRPTLYKAGRVKGTRELVVRPTYVMVYRVLPDAVEVLRVLNTAQQWPSVEASPGYEADDGPLISQQLDDVRKAAKRKAPTGKVVSKKMLR